MAETKVKEEVAKAAPKKAAAKKAAPKAKAPRATKPKAAAQPQLTKEEVQAAMYEAVKTALMEVKAAEAPAEEIKPIVKDEVKPAAQTCPIPFSKAERLMTVLAKIYLVLGLLVSAALIIVGAVMELTTDSFFRDYMDGTAEGWQLILGGVVLLLPTLVQYACMSLFVNVSKRLTSLDSKKC